MDYAWLNPMSQAFLEADYLLPGQTVDERVTQMAQTAEGILGIEGFAQRFVDNVKRGWYSISTPIWTNFGTSRGLPISCFGSYLEDTMDSILWVDAEIGKMSQMGGGTSAYYGNLRSRGSSIGDNGKTHGAVHMMQLPDTKINVVSQGATRRGSCAVYLPITHKDMEELLTIKGEGSPIQNLQFGVTISDEWFSAMVGDGTKTGGDYEKRVLWAKILETRSNVGFPYIVFSDTVNRNTVDVYRDKSLWISHSNLCTEIFLPDSAEESFVCDLSSMNILHYEDWKDTDAVELLTFFLDAVMTEFIVKAKPMFFMQKAVRFAERHRALGIGWLGWHSFLQSKLIPFESMDAKLWNARVAKTINTQAHAASKKLAELYGEPEVLQGYGRRNTTLTAIAPTKSSAFIIGQVSEGIEPYHTNYEIRDLAKGKFTIKNKYLTALLEEKGHNNDEVWLDILKHGGSVQHLEILTDREKSVFRTFGEVSQLEVIIQAAQRQKYIDQGQSINLMIHPDTPTSDVNELYIEAWKLGVKSLYYQKSVNASQAFSRNLLNCVSCES